MDEKTVRQGQLIFFSQISRGLNTKEEWKGGRKQEEKGEQSIEDR